MIRFFKGGVTNPLLPLILLLTIVILITIIISNLTSEPERSAESFYPVPENTQGPSPFPRISGAVPKRTNETEAFSPPDISAVIRTALEEWRAGDFVKAEDHFRTVLVFDQDNPAALSYMGTILYHKGDFKGAEYMFRRQTVAYPSNPGAFLNLAMALLRQNRLNEAIEESKRAYALNPSSEEAALNLARLYAYSGDKWSAIAYLKRAVDSGSRKIDEVLEDRVFDSIRKEEAFRNLRRPAAEETGSSARDSVSGGSPESMPK